MSREDPNFPESYFVWNVAQLGMGLLVVALFSFSCTSRCTGPSEQRRDLCLFRAWEPPGWCWGQKGMSKRR
jgi:hypothetical protein